MKKIYITGHGSWLPDRSFSMPRDTSIEFYCDPSTLLPSITCDRLIQGSRAIVNAQTIGQYGKCFEHRLAELSPSVWLKRQTNFHGDGELVSANRLGRSNVMLSEIVNIYTGSNMANEPIQFHWLSCRQVRVLKSTGGIILGVNAGYHLNEFQSKRSGMYSMPTSLSSNKRVFVKR